MRIIDSDLFSLALEQIRDVVWVVDREGRIVTVNRAAEAVYGYSRTELTDMRVHDLRPPEAVASIEEQLKKAQEEGILFQTRHRRRSGESFPVEVSSRRLCHNERELVVSVIRDISIRDALEAELQREHQELLAAHEELLASEEEIRQQLDELLQKEEFVRRLAYHDSLTGLPNRTMLMEYLDKELTTVRADAAGGAVFFVDVDDLKTVNDNFGHSCGDKIISLIGADLADELGPGSLVARIGGDEFVAVMRGVSDRRTVEQAVARLKERICRDYDLGMCIMNISASIGIAVYPGDGQTAEELLKNVDMALYEAKREGKCTWRFFDVDLQTSVFENMVLKQGLREAVQRQELHLVFQPLLDSRSGEIAGFESLLRWNHADCGPIPPGRFIPLAEESGAIQAIGAWVFDEACRFAARLRDLGKENIRVNVNVSPRQLAADDFTDGLLRTVAAAGIQPGQLELEITETALISSLEKCVAKLADLRSAGFHLALDDFGSGYSSLTYLKSLPVETVKLDQSFIREIAGNPAQQSFVRSIVHMAHGQHLRVTAEGVETPEQLSSLKECDCDLMQGFVFSRPVLADIAVELLMQGFSAAKESTDERCEDKAS